MFLTFPFVLAWKSIRHYLLPTIYVFVARFVGFFVSRALCLACKACGCYKFVDKDFPKEMACEGISWGWSWEGRDWKRASELKPPEGMKRMQLFNKISPHDLAQGACGDCWLIASIAALAEHPSLVRRLFVNHEINDRGKYQVRLYNHHKAKFEIITIDDYLPVESNGTPVFAKPRGGEIWVCLLEKAIAKFWPEIYPDKGGRKGYACIEGNLMTRAFHMFTGDNTHSMHGHNMLPKDELFRLFERECARGALISIASYVDDEQRRQGVVYGHAYTVLDAQRAGTAMGLGLDKGYEMVKIRNPWGYGEWKGDWSDGSSKWSEHPLMASELGKEDKNDGTFWMSMDDFDIWTQIMMCDRTTKDDFCLDMHEELGFCGPVKGCVEGCASFWCLCRGARTVYLGHATRDRLEAPPPGLNCCAAVG